MFELMWATPTQARKGALQAHRTNTIRAHIISMQTKTNKCTHTDTRRRMHRTGHAHEQQKKRHRTEEKVSLRVERDRPTAVQG